MKHTLYGVGLGPGDPELVTIKAISVLQKVGAVFAPASRDGHSLAGEILANYIPEAKIEYLDFPMTTEQAELEKAWNEAAARIVAKLEESDAAFVTLGDPLLYGSYLYIYRKMQAEGNHIPIITIPGITSMSAAAAQSNFYLTEANDRLLITTGQTDLAQFENYCLSFETIVIYKPTMHLNEMLQVFYRICPCGNGVLVERCGMAGEKTTYLQAPILPEKVSYLGVVILHPRSLK